MIEWWMWILIIPAGLLLFVLAALVLQLLLLFMLIAIDESISAMGRKRRARRQKRSDKVALSNRINISDYMGVALPSGKTGTLRIDYHTQLDLTAFELRTLDQMIRQRAIDNHYTMYMEHEFITGDILISWKPEKIKTRKLRKRIKEEANVYAK